MTRVDLVMKLVASRERNDAKNKIKVIAKYIFYFIYVLVFTFYFSKHTALL